MTDNIQPWCTLFPIWNQSFFFFSLRAFTCYDDDFQRWFPNFIIYFTFVRTHLATSFQSWVVRSRIQKPLKWWYGWNQQLYLTDWKGILLKTLLINSLGKCTVIINSILWKLFSQFSFIGDTEAAGNLNSESWLYINSRTLFFCGLTWLQQRCLPFEITYYNTGAIRTSQIFGVSGP